MKYLQHQQKNKIDGLLSGSLLYSTLSTPSKSNTTTTATATTNHMSMSLCTNSERKRRKLRARRTALAMMPRSLSDGEHLGKLMYDDNVNDAYENTQMKTNQPSGNFCIYLNRFYSDERTWEASGNSQTAIPF